MIPIVPKNNVKIHTTKGSLVPHDHPVVAQPKCQNYSLAQRLLRCKSARLQRKFRARLAKHGRTTFKEARRTTRKPRARRKRENQTVRRKDEGQTIRKTKEQRSLRKNRKSSFKEPKSTNCLNSLRPRPKWRRSKTFQRSRFRREQTKYPQYKSLILMHQRMKSYMHYQTKKHNETHIKPFNMRPMPKWQRSKIFQRSRFRMDQNKNLWPKCIILTSQQQTIDQSYKKNTIIK